jgi:hypothetical protein
MATTGRGPTRHYPFARPGSGPDAGGGGLGPGRAATRPPDPVTDLPAEPLVSGRGFHLPPARRKLAQLAKANGFARLPGENNLQLVMRYVPGGRDGVVQYLRHAAADGDKDAQTWLHVWDTMKPWERLHASLDDVCAASGLSPVKFLKLVVGVAFEMHCDLANLVAAVAHPEVVEASIETAKMLGPVGFEDRKLLMQHHRFIPIPRGTSINIGVSASAQAAASASTDSSVPSFAADAEHTEGPRAAIQRQLIASADATDAPVVFAPDPPADDPDDDEDD